MTCRTEIWPLNSGEIEKRSDEAEGRGERVVSLVPLGHVSAGVIALLAEDEAR